VLLCTFLGLTCGRQSVRPAPSPQLVYIGTYAQGIYVANWDPASNLFINKVTLGASVLSSSWLTFGSDSSALFAVSEVENFNNTNNNGGVVAFKISEDGRSLREVNSEGTGGGAPCDVTFVTPPSSTPALLVANYMGGSVASYSIEDSGRIGPVASFYQFEGHGPNQPRQDAPHAHQIISPDGKLVLAVDLGNDRVRNLCPVGCLAADFSSFLHFGLSISLHPRFIPSSSPTPAN